MARGWVAKGLENQAEELSVGESQKGVQSENNTMQAEVWSISSGRGVQARRRSQDYMAAKRGGSILCT